MKLLFGCVSEQLISWSQSLLTNTAILIGLEIDKYRETDLSVHFWYALTGKVHGRKNVSTTSYYPSLCHVLPCCCALQGSFTTSCFSGFSIGTEFSGSVLGWHPPQNCESYLLSCKQIIGITKSWSTPDFWHHGLDANQQRSEELSRLLKAATVGLKMWDLSEQSQSTSAERSSLVFLYFLSRLMLKALWRTWIHQPTMRQRPGTSDYGTSDYVLLGAS